MKDFGILKGLVQKFDTNSDRGNYFAFRKMFRDYLNKLHVPFTDLCCIDSDLANLQPVGFSATTGLGYYDAASDSWISVESAQSVTALTAFATGGQTSGTQLAPGFNEVTVVATAGDSVKLPAAVEGLLVTVKNEGVAAADVFPATADTINDAAANAAVRIAPQSTITFRAINATNWETDNQVLSTNTVSEQTSAAGVTVDGALIKDGGISANSMFAGFLPVTAQQALSGAGAVNVTAYYTAFTSSGAGQALTLANGTQIGQLKVIAHVVDGGSGVLTPTSLSGGTTITFTTVGEAAELIWNGTAWVAVRLFNTATPGTPPVLA